MKKTELVNIIKSAYKEIKSKDSVDLDNDSITKIEIESEKFPMLDNHLELKKWLKDIFLNQHEIFIQDIEWVSPNPLTFRIVLINDEFFYMIKTNRTWIAKIEGKKYYLLNTSEFDIACQAISRLLEYTSTLNQDIKSDETEDTESDTQDADIEEPETEEQ